MGLPPSGRDPDEVREAAEEILAQARYDRPPEPIIDRVLGWFGDLIGDLIGTLVGGGGGTVIAWLVLVGAVSAIVYLLVRNGRVNLPRAAPGPTARVMVEMTRSAREWRDEAASLEREGRWREGLRCRHRALVADLVRAGAIPEQAGRTAGEYVGDVARSIPDAAASMAAATELFEAAWYGGAPTGPAEAERFARLEGQVLAARASR